MINFSSPALRVSRQLQRQPKVSGRLGLAVGGLVPDSVLRPFTGGLHSDVAGRTDHIPTHVPSGSYVIPADIVSGIGEGNSINGLKVLGQMFSAAPREASKDVLGLAKMPYAQQSNNDVKRFGLGGVAHKQSSQKPTPVIVAGGEFVVHPDDVKKIGNGDIDRGHKVLDSFVLQMRKSVINTLKKLPGPAK